MARDEINAFLGSGTTYQGRLEFKGSVRIDGSFNGEVESEGTLVIGREAHVEGTLHVGQLIVSGRVKGEVRALAKVVLHKTANFDGSMSTPVLMMEEGAVLEGQVSMGTKKTEKPVDDARSGATGSTVGLATATRPTLAVTK
ncbi:cytoskeletal protein CcmA (bactofilin family) [Desulfobaculum xiamenense]|uniref:Cytoskeletal protein CcmA (Bactofilin family) n=1 Tax=Desulfobaculum xiamenense TaxID=995050 RepID=A0A846QPE6_9BACT|nr:polymer-forming cytoskeletal protein [Desulfobaculum xiamenense]NJB68183.1 cytoskeletal protein CcmA (bactofilin family) [Desulfobaculum xiamenense]